MQLHAATDSYTAPRACLPACLPHQRSASRLAIGIVKSAVESYAEGSMLAGVWLQRVGDVDTRSRMLLAVASMRLSAQRMRLLQVRGWRVGGQGLGFWFCEGFVRS